jgi:hypothetical protein
MQTDKVKVKLNASSRIELPGGKHFAGRGADLWGSARTITAFIVPI